MCSKDLTELPELKELLNRLIVRKHMCSVAVASLLPLLLGYIAYRMVVDLGARLVPQDVFFLVGVRGSATKSTVRNNTDRFREEVFCLRKRRFAFVLCDYKFSEDFV